MLKATVIGEVEKRNWDGDLPRRFARAINHGTEVYLSRTTVAAKEKERTLQQKKHFPWMDLVNEALDVLWKQKLKLCNFKPRLLCTNNQRIIGRHGVSGHMVEKYKSDESMSAVHKDRFGNGLVAYQSRLLKNRRPVLVQDGFINKKQKDGITHPIHCSCCFGATPKRWNVEHFVVQEIGRVTVQLCDVCVETKHMGQHVGVTLEEVTPHSGDCYLRVGCHRLQPFSLPLAGKDNKGNGFSLFQARSDISVMIDEPAKSDGNDGWPDKGNTPKNMHCVLFAVAIPLKPHQLNHQT